jgi:uncharacterized LabA/DUF88 family protein
VIVPQEPERKRVVAFFDGQNLFHAAKDAFGSSHPDYDPLKLAQAVCQGVPSWELAGVRFYTGLHDASVDPFWHRFWTRKLAILGTRGVHIFTRPLRYRNQTIVLRDGSTTTALVGSEKGVDVRIALDIVRLARENEYDVALVFSQDQDLSEAADEVKAISRRDDRWIGVASAYPHSPPTYRNTRGITNTQWIKIDRAVYGQCIDPTDYR